MDCKYCEGDKHLIKEYNHWKVYLHKNQCYLGRCKIALNRHIEDLTEVNSDERDELFSIMKNLRKVIVNSFDANLFNYTSAGNITKHLHIHFIPRYSHEVKFEGQKFKDENWGENHSPYPRNLKFQSKLLESIKQKIKSQL